MLSAVVPAWKAHFAARLRGGQREGEEEEKEGAREERVKKRIKEMEEFVGGLREDLGIAELGEKCGVGPVAGLEEEGNLNRSEDEEGEGDGNRDGEEEEILYPGRENYWGKIFVAETADLMQDEAPGGFEMEQGGVRLEPMKEGLSAIKLYDNKGEVAIN